MSETKSKAIKPYIEQQPGNPLLASDWNSMQVQIREDIAQACADLDATRAELGSTQAELEKTRAALGKTTSDLERAQLALRETRDGLDAARKDVLTLRGELDELRRLRQEVAEKLNAIDARMDLSHFIIGKPGVDYGYESIRLNDNNNLRIYFGGRERFQLHHDGTFKILMNRGHFVFQTDGNLVRYGDGGVSAWDPGPGWG